jgi:hypothetical protein
MLDVPLGAMALAEAKVQADAGGANILKKSGTPDETLQAVSKWKVPKQLTVSVDLYWKPKV